MVLLWASVLLFLLASVFVFCPPASYAQLHEVHVFKEHVGMLPREVLTFSFTSFFVVFMCLHLALCMCARACEHGMYVCVRVCVCVGQLLRDLAFEVVNI